MTATTGCAVCGRLPGPLEWVTVTVSTAACDYEPDVCSWECLARWAGDRVADELRGRSGSSPEPAGNEPLGDPAPMAAARGAAGVSDCPLILSAIVGFICWCAGFVVGHFA